MRFNQINVVSRTIDVVWSLCYTTSSLIYERDENSTIINRCATTNRNLLVDYCRTVYCPGHGHVLPYFGIFSRKGGTCGWLGVGWVIENRLWHNVMPARR